MNKHKMRLAAAMQRKNREASTRPVGAWDAGGSLHTYKWPLPEGSSYHPFFEGMPEFSEDWPLCCILLTKIQSIAMHEILWGKDEDLNEEAFRQYEFRLSGFSIAQGWGKLMLIIKGQANFFTHQDEYEYAWGGAWQKIPLTYSTMSKMTDEEVSIIYTDFD